MTKEFEEVHVGKSTVKQKEIPMSDNQQVIDLEVKDFKRSLEEQREELRQEQECPVENAPVKEEIVLPAEKFVFTADELAKVISAAQGGAPEPHIALRLPKDLSMAGKALYIADDALAEVGRGLHRTADGCRDIVGGIIDIFTLGRANRR